MNEPRYPNGGILRAWNMFHDPLNRDERGAPVVGALAIEYLLRNPGDRVWSEKERIMVAALAERHPE